MIGAFTGLGSRRMLVLLLARRCCSGCCWRSPPSPVRADPAKRALAAACAWATVAAEAAGRHPATGCILLPLRQLADLGGAAGITLLLLLVNEGTLR
jgi:hypothetical protein